MKRKSVLKRIIVSSVAAALVISAAAATANADEVTVDTCADVASQSVEVIEGSDIEASESIIDDTQPIKYKLDENAKYTSTYQSYLDGKITVSQNSGVLPTPYEVKGSKLNFSGALPSSYKSDTTGIRDQGYYNSCWSFSAMGALEGLLSKEGRGKFDLSESHLGWWTTPDYNSDGYGWIHNGFQNGGFSIIGSGYFMAWQGPKLEQDIPYDGYSYMTLPSNMKTAKNTYNVTGAIYVDKDIDSIKAAIYRYGAVASSFNASDAGFDQDYKNYYQSNETTNFEGHAVTFIGWDDKYSRNNFNASDRPSKDGAWLAKNSWGTDVGENGYFWISYYDRYAFDTETWGPNIAYTSVRTANNYDKLYQNEIYGGVVSFALQDNSGNFIQKMTYANVFDFDSAHPYLEEVIFESQSEGANYTAYYIPVSNGVPVTDQSKWTALKSGTVDNNGYVKVDTLGFTVPSGKGAIGIVMDASNTSYASSIGSSEWIPMGYSYALRPKNNRNSSFIIDGGEVLDLMDLYSAWGDEEGATFVIKAVTSSQIIGDVNGDFVSDSLDSVSILRQSIGLDNFNNSQRINADVNFDGELDSLDAVTIQRKSVGLFSEY